MITDLYYDEEHNKMMDSDGYLVFDIFRFVTPSMLLVFLDRKESMTFETEPGQFVNLFWPEDDDWQDEY